ncbi:MAG: heavy-metal-associated domain-containing protein [Saprospiraceae bacterium]
MQNLKCAGCAGTIIRSLSSVAGISDVQVDQENDAVDLMHQKTAGSFGRRDFSTPGVSKVDDPNSLLHKAKSFVRLCRN